MCKGCHQNQHGGNFSGYDLHPVNGKDPDPEGRMKKYIEDRQERQAKRRETYYVWGTDKKNGKIVVEAAEALGVDPRVYIAEALYMRLQEDGFDCDMDLFVPEFKKSSIRD